MIMSALGVRGAPLARWGGDSVGRVGWVAGEGFASAPQFGVHIA